MAFSSSVTNKIVIGNRKMTYGTFTNTSTDYGGTVDTGLQYVDYFAASVNSHIGAEVAKIVKNKNIAGTATPGSVAVSISHDADADWMAIGL